MNWLSFVLGYLAAFLTLGVAVWLGELLARRALEQTRPVDHRFSSRRGG